MNGQLLDLIALGLADWFSDQVDDPRFAELNNLDPDRLDGCGDPFELAAQHEAERGCPLAWDDPDPDLLDELIRAALLYHPDEED